MRLTKMNTVEGVDIISEIFKAAKRLSLADALLCILSLLHLLTCMSYAIYQLMTDHEMPTFLILLLFQTITLIIVLQINFADDKEVWTLIWTLAFILVGALIVLGPLYWDVYEQSHENSWAQRVYFTMAVMVSSFAYIFRFEVLEDENWLYVLMVLHVATCLSWASFYVMTGLKMTKVPTLLMVQMGECVLICQNKLADGRRDPTYTQIWLATFVGTGVGTMGLSVYSLLQSNGQCLVMDIHVPLIGVTAMLAVLCAFAFGRRRRRMLLDPSMWMA